MTGTETSALLDAADQHLSCAVDHLLALDQPGEALLQAAQILQKMQREWDPKSGHACAGPRLLSLATRCAMVEQLLDSAVTLHLGRFSGHTDADETYGADGALHRSCAERSLVLNG